MYNPSSSDARWVVASQLYLRLQKLTPGTKEAEITEHALSLALNPKRKPKNATFFFHEVLRNARYSIQRTQTRRSALFEQLATHPAPATDNIDYKTPEAICIAWEIEAKLREAAAQNSPHTVRCLDGMLAGESVSETAAACGLSRRSVNRARQKIREISLPLFFTQEAGWVRT